MDKVEFDAIGKSVEKLTVWRNGFRPGGTKAMETSLVKGLTQLVEAWITNRGVAKEKQEELLSLCHKAATTLTTPALQAAGVSNDAYIQLDKSAALQFRKAESLDRKQRAQQAFQKFGKACKNATIADAERKTIIEELCKAVKESWHEKEDVGADLLEMAKSTLPLLGSALSTSLCLTLEAAKTESKDQCEEKMQDAEKLLDICKRVGDPNSAMYSKFKNLAQWGSQVRTMNGNMSANGFLKIATNMVSMLKELMGAEAAPEGFTPVIQEVQGVYADMQQQVLHTTQKCVS